MMSKAIEDVKFDQEDINEIYLALWDRKRELENLISNSTSCDYRRIREGQYKKTKSLIDRLKKYVNE